MLLHSAYLLIGDHGQAEDVLQLTLLRKSLPLRQREVVVLRFFAGLTIPDTAAAIGSSEATVKSHTRRALARLRELLANDSPAIIEKTNEVPSAD